MQPNTANVAPDAPKRKVRSKGHVTPAGVRLTFFPENALKDWRLGRAQMRVLVALSAFTSGDTGQCRPAQETVADIAGLTREKTNVLITDLVALGYLVKIHRSRCWTYQVMNPDIPARGVPRGGTLPKSKIDPKKFPKGVQDRVPTGGTPTVPTEGTQTLRTSVEPLQEVKRTGLTPEHIDGADQAVLAGTSSRSARVQGRTFEIPKDSFSAAKTGDVKFSPITEATKHLSRQDLTEFMTMAGEQGTDAALEHFGLDYRGIPIQHARQGNSNQEVKA